MFDQKDYIFKIVVEPKFFGEVMLLTFDQSHIERNTDFKGSPYERIIRS